MLLKQIILLFVSIIALMLFFDVHIVVENGMPALELKHENNNNTPPPIYNDWVNRYLLNPDIKDQFDKLDIHERMEDRFGFGWQICQNMHKLLDTVADKKDIYILLPPNSYLQSLNIRNINLPEPAIFYYLSGFFSPPGFKTLWTTSPEVEKANWAIVVQGKGLNFIKIQDTAELHQLLNLYKKYTPAL